MYASGGEWRRSRHLMFLAEQVMRVVRGEIKRLCISVPPRHGKSEYVSKYLPSWWLGAHPTHEVVLASFGSALTRQWSTRCRDALSDYGEEVFGVSVWHRAKATDWRIYVDGEPKGGLYAVGKGGALTGRGAHLLICDDLVRDHSDANSPALREHTWQWFTSVALTRLMPGARAIVIQTRWHHDDLIGRLEAMQDRGELGERWEFLNLPCLAEEGDPLEREPGEPLWPEVWGAEWADKKRREVGPYVWSALYQGRPTPVEGGLFKRQWLRFYEREGEGFRVPDHGRIELGDLYRFVTVDLAASKSSRADYTAFMVFGAEPKRGILLVLDVVRERLEGPEIIPRLRQTLEDWAAAVAYVEVVGFQLTLVQQALREGLPIRRLKPDRDKVSRAMPATAAMEGGQVFFRKDAHWLPALEDELLSFDSGEHDDQVDCLAYGVQIFRGGQQRRRPSMGPGKQVRRVRRVY